MVDRPPTVRSNDQSVSASPPVTSNHSQTRPLHRALFYWLRLPPPNWSLTLLGLCIYTFAIVTYYAPIAQVGIAIAAVGLLLGRERIRLPAPIRIFAAFVLWAFVASLASPYGDIALESLLDHLKLLALMFIVVNALRTEGQVRFYLLFFLGCFVLFPVRGTLAGDDDVMGRVVWNYIYNNPNDLAALCLFPLGISLGIVLCKHTHNLVRLGAGVCVILLVIVILLTQSRGAFIGLVVGIGPALIGWGLRRPARLVLYAAPVALTISLSIPASVWQRLAGIEKLTSEETIAQADPEGSAEQRYEVQKVAWQIFVDHPVFGVGLGAYPLANAKYAPDLGARDTHNTYLNLAAEVGVPGLALWCALVLSVLRYASRSRRLAPQGALTTQQAWIERAFLAFLVAGIFSSYAKLAFPYLSLALLWCSAALLSSPSRSEEGAAVASRT
jgi:O-antigen ligase